MASNLFQSTQITITGYNEHRSPSRVELWTTGGWVLFTVQIIGSTNHCISATLIDSQDLTWTISCCSQDRREASVGLQSSINWRPTCLLERQPTPRAYILSRSFFEGIKFVTEAHLSWLALAESYRFDRTCKCWLIMLLTKVASRAQTSVC